MLEKLEKPFISREGSEFFIEGKIAFAFDGDRITLAHPHIKSRGYYPVDSRIFYDSMQRVLSTLVMPNPEMRTRWFQICIELEESLVQEMKEFGIEVRSIKLNKVFFKNDLNIIQKPLDAKILIIGLDGADWDILNPLMESGRLPNLKKLRDRGSSGKLLTINPSLSPIVWTSMATGKKPDKHGIMDFLAIDERTGSKVPVTSNLRRVRAMWGILGDLGIKVGIVGWWATWPAESVNGYIITDRVAYQLFGISSRVESAQGKTYPPSLYSKIATLIVRPEEMTWDDIKRFFGPEAMPEDFEGEKAKLMEDFKTLYSSSETYRKIYLFLEERTNADLEAVYFEGTDTVCHLFMRYRKPRITGVTDREMKIFGDTIDRYYEYIDGVIGEILSRKDESWTIIVCSDHGFKVGGERPITYDARIDMGKAAFWHERYGILIAAGKNIRRGMHVEEGRILDLLPTVLSLYGLPVGADMDGRTLIQLFDPVFLERYPVRFTNSYEREVTLASSETPIESDMDQEIREKLLSLGYISSDSDNSFNNRGLVLINRGDFKEAIEQFKKALEINPSFTAAMTNMGIAKMHMKELDGAIDIFKEVLRREPDNMEVENLLGNVYMEKGELHSAEEHFRIALSIEPRYADAINSLGILYERMGRLEEALKEYRKTIEIDLDYAEGYNNIGNIWKMKGYDEEAIRWYEKAIDVDPFFIGSYNNIALIYQESGDLNKAIQYFNKALERAPNNAIVMNNLGSLYFHRGEIKPAMDIWKKAIEIQPGYESPYNNLGVALGKQGMFEEEIKMYQKALQLRPDYVDARKNLGLAYFRNGESERGLRELDRIVQKDPGNIKIWILMARNYFEREEYQKGLSLIEKALSYESQNINLLNMAGEASAYIGNNEEALRYFQKSLSLVPDQKNIRVRIQSLSH
ncbi:MAG: tetratricopeptide repeat protein [Acidobacteriota bacterium]